MSERYPTNTGHICGTLVQCLTKTVGVNNNLVADLLINLPGNKPQDVPIQAAFEQAERFAKVPIGSWVDLVYRLEGRAWEGRIFLSAKVVSFGVLRDQNQQARPVQATYPYQLPPSPTVPRQTSIPAGPVYPNPSGGSVQNPENQDELMPY